MKPGPAACSICAGDFWGAVEIVDFEADDGEQVGLVEEALRVGEAQEAHLRVVLVEAGVEDAGEAEALVLGDECRRGHFALRADDHDGVADGCADGVREIAAENDGRPLLIAGVDGAAVGLEGTDGAGRGGVENVAHGGFFIGEDAFNERAAVAGSAGDEDLFVEAG
jgi:hypothetical protein